MKYISLRMRLWSLLITLVSFATTYNIQVNKDTYAAPVFNTVKQVGLETWEVLWFLTGTAGVVSAIMGRNFFWRIALVGAMWTSSFWVIGLSWEVFIHGAQISWSGLSLWVFFCLAHLYAAKSNAQFDYVKSIKEML